VSELVWSPVYRVLEDRLKAGDKLILLVVPFIKEAALKQLLWVTDKCPHLKVVVRWRPGDLIAGVADLEIFPFLKEQGIPLFFNQNIHLKLYAFESNDAFVTSGNLTLSGLGYAEKGNVEVGNMVALRFQDWQQLFAIVDGSMQVDETVYASFQQALANSPKPTSESPCDPWPQFARKLFTIQTLPASETPTALIDFYLRGDFQESKPELYRRFAHDLAIYQVPIGLDMDALKKFLINAVKDHPFIVSFVAELRQQSSMSFGAVTAWLHDHCEDVPVPYRYVVKDSVRTLFNWLEFAYQEISWDTPRYAQVIYWRPK
jgi:hypothetical protein